MYYINFALKINIEEVILVADIKVQFSAHYIKAFCNMLPILLISPTINL